MVRTPSSRTPTPPRPDGAGSARRLGEARGPSSDFGFRPSFGFRISDFGFAPPAGGFTLIELLIVMTLLIVVLSVAAPSLAGFFRGRSLDSEAHRLLTMVRHGQSRAVFEGVPMLLWLDPKGRCYGLEEEAGYTERDEQAVEFTLDQEVAMEVADLGLKVLMSAPANRVVRLGAGPNAAQHRNLPRIRFLPDGSFAESSPQIVRLQDREGASLCLILATNRLKYEIQSQYRPW